LLRPGKDRIGALRDEEVIMSLSIRPSRFRASFLVAAALVLSWLGVARGATKTVQVGPGNALVFSPQTVTVDVGDTVTWKWMSGPHTTTRASGSETWDSGIMATGATFSHTFTQAGTFPYVCTIHVSLGMTGTVKVNAPMTSTTLAGGATTTATTPSGGGQCATVQSCQAQLLAALPTPQSATKAKEKRVARMLHHLAQVADAQIAHASTRSGSKRSRLVSNSTKTLQRLRKVADTAASKGTLGVPVESIDQAVDRLLAVNQ
jgi:plastocyanin